jgi:hypothetical protein
VRRRHEALLSLACDSRCVFSDLSGYLVSVGSFVGEPDYAKTGSYRHLESEMTMKAIICDIDGVIADLTHRLEHITGETKNWEAFFEACTDDDPIMPVIRFLNASVGYFDIIYVTGRPERVRDKTIAWFEKNSVPFFRSQTRLLMRKDGDHRHDTQVKRELFRQFIDQTNVIAVIEDRDAVVEMWRNEGLLCFQPRNGDF